MTATNHVLAGAIIGSYLPLPVALPAALASHFTLDAIPHYGIEDNLRDRHFIYKSVIVGDAILCTTFLALMFYHQKWNMLAGAIVAFLPDLIWVYKYTRYKTLDIKHGNWFTTMHSRIQKWERSWGLALELLIFYPLFVVFMTQLLK